VSFFRIFVRTVPSGLGNIFGPANGKPNLAKVFSVTDACFRRAVGEVAQNQVSDEHGGIPLSEFLIHEFSKST
jgi:hypothetical protein